MYIPPHYIEARSDLIFETIRRFSFATIVTSDDEFPQISHLPLILEGSNKSLIGHCARANPHWQQFAKTQLVTAIFSGPSAYISPAWYQPQPDNVPTWNYVAIHVRGAVELIEEPAEVYSVMQTMVSFFESRQGTGWDLPQVPNKSLEAQLSAIVAFRINIKEINAQFKLSQAQNARNRNAVIQNLPKTPKPLRTQ